ncbi:MAG: hypothetical protein ABI759_14595 [Candidatus Solibacter sp.]
MTDGALLEGSGQALGGGRTVFTAGGKLRLTDQRAFPGGNVVVTYAV